MSTRWLKQCLPSLCAFACALTIFPSISSAQFTDVTTKTEPWSSGNSRIKDIQYSSGSGLWVFGGVSGALVTTTDMANFSNRSKNIATGGQDINSFATDGTIWAFGLSTNSLSPKLKTTTDFVNFTDRTSALDIGPYLIYSLKRGGSIWAIGAEIGKLKTTTNFENFTDRTSDLNFTSTVGAIGTDGTTWAFGGSAGKFKTTTDFVTFSDLTATISMGGVAIQSI